MPRFLRNFVKARWKGAFEFGQRLGVDLLPRHWYSSIPDFRELRRDDRWRVPYDMTGVRGIEIEEQFEAVQSVATPEILDRLAKGDVWPTACHDNGEEGYGPADADLLYAVVATRRPARVIQVGCGVSTALLLRLATERNMQLDLICVDPYPTTFLRRASADARIKLIEAKAEHVEPKTLADLRAGDLLFIDSSHTTRPGSDVHHLILRVLPLLPPGVLVHVHDVHWPYDYSPNLFAPNDLFFGSEPALLHAYLIHNLRMRVAASASMLHGADPQRLATLLPNYRPFKAEHGLNPPDRYGQSPSSAWLLAE